MGSFKTVLQVVIGGGLEDGKRTLIAALLSHAGGNGSAAGTTNRHFSTADREFVLLDMPVLGSETEDQEQYARNIVDGFSNADCAVVLVDAVQGLHTQTRHQTQLLSLLGVRDVALAVNKMDRISYSEARFRELEREYREFAQQVGLERVSCIPVSALMGDNVFSRSEAVQGYDGPTLIDYLEAVQVDEPGPRAQPFRMPVSSHTRLEGHVRGYGGRIASGSVRSGEQVVIVPSGQRTAIDRIITPQGAADEAGAGESVTVTLASPAEAPPGAMIGALKDPPSVADQFEATIVWMGEEPMFRGRSYLLRISGHTVPATIAPLKHKLDVESLEPLAATQLERNEIGVCELELDHAVAFDPHRENRATAGFLVADRISRQTVGAGLINCALRRSQNVRWQPLTIDKHSRAALLGQRSTVLWLTGLPGAGKSTIANLVEAELHGRGHYTYVLDGDNVRHGLNADLGFTEADRVENIRRVAEVAHLMLDAGLIVVVSFISPFRAERTTARAMFEADEFYEVFVDAPLEVAEQRDPKGLYRKARRGDLVNFTGIDSPYEPPQNPELTLDTTALSPREAADEVIELLEIQERLNPPPRPHVH